MKNYDLPAAKSSAALHYAERGWPVLPVQPTSKAPIGRLAPNGCKDATTDEQEIHDWWNVVPSANIGVATGDVFVVDLDVKGDANGIAAWSALTDGRPVPETRAVLTPSGGRHIYFRAPEGVRIPNDATGKYLAAGVDVKGHGGYILAPPSATDQGTYEVEKDAPVADAPGWLIEKLTAASSNGHEPAPPVEGDILKGERNSRLTSLAGTMRRRGMGEAAMRAALLEENRERCDPPLPKREVLQIAKSVARYKPGEKHPRQNARNGTSTTSTTSTTPPQKDPLALEDAPSIPDDAFENLPAPLGEVAGFFSQRHERDVMLTGALGVLSGCLPNVGGYYGHNAPRLLRPNLNVAVVAPAAAGKGPLHWAERLGQDVDTHLRDESKKARQGWEQEREAREGEGERFDVPKPPKRSLYLPANTSAAAFHEGLADRRGRAVICETEIDSLTNALGQEWGQFDDTLRKAFHHERVSYSRKGEGEVVVEDPRLSVVLAGTPRQHSDLMRSAESGLYSRSRRTISAPLRGGSANAPRERASVASSASKI